ncbi:[citrate (pro-3S)-lyase] ligase [Propionivibrio dicarboxylicus]|uniref:[Citrate [pro-3S]-lyase] ligase n=1 Tax=Propionivibrio dicarboxylicus TaxID=83767 RepID=A0A1G8EZL2_9RHOO|nr:[citrate (pro-3S)-lyase] ligase [Propionivibrio dicarboxylicus]SDH75277.1 [citrate (pro-3S)-lyase] ligase [Propionivibrio dicarboxylicus]
MIVELASNSERKMAQALIEARGLAFEECVDVTYGIYESEQLVATGSRAGNILKMLALAPEHQGGSVLGELATELVMSGLRAGHESLFVYTKPEFVLSFQALNFTLLAHQEKVALLEYGQGLTKWLESKKGLMRPGLNGAVVVNCNPFTNGHLYLIENAAQRVDSLYVFVVKEDRSVFPFNMRYWLVEQGVRHISNAVLLDTSHYIVSGATFPTYFLKKDDPIARIQMELDVTLFASRIAPYFGITRRFVGTEPNCALTGGYNAAMLRTLPAHGIELQVVERKQTDTGVISASKVRELVGQGDLARLADYVPTTTRTFLESDEAAPIRERLQQDFRNRALNGC